MMNDAMRATETMVRAAVAAKGSRYKAERMQERGSCAHIHITDTLSGSDLGHVVVHESGRWSEYRTLGYVMMQPGAELAALQFKRG